MTVELSHAEYGAGPPLVILHGLFGSARNWTTLARQLGETHRVYALDLRNHGASGWAETMTYEEMAGDVRAFLVRHGLEGAAVMGHSMGGKTAMWLAVEEGSLIGRLIVVDIAPVAYGHTHGPMIAAMQGADLAAATRRGEVDRHLEAQIPEAALRSFLLQNLVMEDGRLRWRINLDALAANLAVLTGYPDNLVGRRYDGPALFLAGAESDYLLPDYHGAIRALFPQAEIGVIEGAGHWVHAERPQAFLERVQAFLI
jgi:pimeloyl-ACP methyl ester carboxylesterase